MTNPFTDLFREDAQRKPAQNPFTQVFAEPDKGDSPERLAALSRNPIAPPAVMGEAAKLGRLFDLPADVVARNIDEVRSGAADPMANWRRLTEDAPKTAAWMQDPINHSLASDNVEPLSRLERLVGRYSLLPRMGAVQVGNVPMPLTQFQQTAPGLPQQEFRQARETQSARGALALIPRGLRTEAQQMQLDGLTARQQEELSPSQSGVESFARAAAKILPSYAAMAEGAVVGAAVGAASGAIGGPVGAVAGAAYGAFGNIFLMEAGNAVADFENVRDEQGRRIGNDGTAYALGLTYGVASTALERVGFGFVADPFMVAGKRFIAPALTTALTAPTMRTALWEGAKAYGAAIVGETVTETLQTGLQLLGENDYRMLARWGGADVRGVTADDAIAALKETAVSTAMGMAVLGVPGAGLRSASELGAATEAVARRDRLAESFKIAIPDAVRERDPQRFRELVQSAADGKSVYIDAARATILLQEANLSPEEFTAAAGISMQDWNQATAAGTDLAIPVASLITDLAPTPLGEMMLPDLSYALGGMTAREAEGMLKDAEAFKERVRKEAEAVGTIEESDPAYRIVDDLRAKLEAAGRTPAVAMVEAQAAAKPYIVWAKAIASKNPENPMADPWTLYSRKGGLGIIGGERAEATFDAVMAVSAARKRGAPAEEIAALESRVQRLADERVQIRAVLEEADQLLDVRDEEGRLRSSLRNVSTDALVIEFIRLRTIVEQANGELATLEARQVDPNATAQEQVGAMEEAGVSVGEMGEAETWAGKLAAYQRYLRTLRSQVRKVERSVPRLMRELEARGVTAPDLYARENQLGGTFVVPTDIPFQRGIDSVALLMQAAFHGTPYTVDRFSTQFIGTGEGAQAFGWGLYFAEAMGVAEGYRRQLSEGQTWRDADGNRISDIDIANQIGYDLAAEFPNYKRVGLGAYEGSGFADRAMRLMAAGESRDGALASVGNDADGIAARAVEMLYDGGYSTANESGNLYRVDIPDAAVATYLDWDKPLQEQALFVRNALAVALGPDSDWMFGDNIDGGDAYRKFEQTFRGVKKDKQASKALLAAGIRGIKYLDAGSRTSKWTYSFRDGFNTWRASAIGQIGPNFASEAEAKAWVEEENRKIEEGETRNLVVFDESDVTITHRNGEPVTAQERTDFLAQEGMQAETLGETIDVDGVSRPTTNSTGQPIHPTAEGVRNFWRWFGSSRVVDAEGRPLVVYHGTNVGVDEFTSLPIFTTPDPAEASAYAVRSAARELSPDEPIDALSAKEQMALVRDAGVGMQVYPVYVRSLNLLDATKLGVAPSTKKAFAFLQSEGVIAEDEDWQDYDNAMTGDSMMFWAQIEDADLVTDIESAGFDGFRFVDASTRGGRHDAIAVLDPTQVKSALSNSGAFGPSADILMQTASVRSGVETLEEFGLDPKKTYTNREVATALERRQREKYGTVGREDRSPEAMKRIAEWMVAEVEFEMQNPEGSGIGWYSEKFQAALDALGQEFPEMVEGGTLPNGDTLTRQGARDLVTAIVAITSDGADVQDNLKLAVGVYRNFRETGTFELQRGHQRESSFKGNLADITKMYRDYGADGMREVLLETKTIKELKVIAKARGMKFESDYQVTMRMPMSAVIFGEKLGAFYANLMGQANYLTMDRWWSRTFNRYRGTLLTVPTEAGLERFKELLEADAKALAKSTKTPVPVIDEEQIVSAVIKYQQEYEERGFKTELAILVGKQQPSGKAAAEKWMAEAKAKAGKEFDSLYQLHELERAANTLSKAMFESLEDAPFSAKDRTFMIDTVAQARTFLGEKGFDVSPADLQAILWYYEKKLYGQLTRKKGKGTKGVSYADAARVALDATRPGGPADAGVSAGVADGRDVADGVAGEAAIFGDEAEAVEAGDKPFKSDVLAQGTGRPNAYFLRTERVIGLMAGTNLSSVMHEMSHEYLATLEAVVSDPDVPEWLKQDFEVAVQAIGIEAGERDAFVQYLRTGLASDQKTLNRFVAAEEKWARSFESYLEKGEAPSRDLLRAFATFRVWFGQVYRALRQMLIPISPELRGVFDRMLATDEEIAEYRQFPEATPLFMERPEGMTDAQWTEYTKGFRTRDALAGAALVKRILAETRAAVSQDWENKKVEVEASIREELAFDPLVQAVEFLRVGTDGEPMKLDRALLNVIAPDLWKSFPKGTTAADGVMTLDAVALKYGFPDALSLATALQGYQEVKDVVAKRLAETFRREYGDLLGDSTAMAEAVSEATHKAETDEPLVRELKALGQQLGMRVVDKPALVQLAREMLAKMRVADIQPSKYELAEAREARASEAALRNGNTEQTAFHKRRQLLNRILVRESRTAVAEVEKIRAFALRMSKDPAQATLGKAGESFTDAMNAVLAEYEFARVSRRQIGRREALDLYVKDVEARGGVPMLSDAIRKDAGLVNYRALPLEELAAVDAAMRQIWHHAKTVNTIASEGRKISLEQAAKEIAVSLEKHRPHVEMNTDGTPISLGKSKELVQAIDAWHLPPTFLFRWLDGDNYGATWRLFFEPIQAAENAELTRLREASKRVAEIEKMVDFPPFLLDVGKSYDGIRSKLTRRQLLALAMNWGNASSRKTVLEAKTGDGYPQFGSAAAIDAMFAQALTEQDWKYAQARWDYANEFWPEIADLERRMTGIVPDKIEAAPFMIATKDGKTVAVRGGYYPLSYDRKLGLGKGLAKMGKDEVETDLGSLAFVGGARAQTKHGWTNERVGSAGKPLDLSLGVWNRHIQSVIHDLTHREAVRDVYALWQREDVRVALVRASGQEYYDSIKAWLVRVANPMATVGDSSYLEKVLQLTRVGTTTVNLGLKFSSGVAQTLGYVQSLEAIGPKWMSVGMGEFMPDMARAMRGQSTPAIDFVMASSPMMANRKFNYNRDVADYARSKFGKLTDLDAFNFWFIGTMDGMVSFPTWIGAYRKAMAANGNDHDAAVRVADDTVESSQGAGAAKDLARIQGGTELRKLMTMHYTAFSRMFGQFRRATTNRAMGKYGTPRFLAAMTALWFGQVVLGELLGGRWPDDDEEPAQFWLWKIMSFPASFFIGIRDLVNAIGPNAYGYKLTPAEAAFERTTKAANAVYRETLGDLFHGADREMTEAEARALVEAPGYWFRLPTKAIWQYGDYLMDWAQGEVAPANPVEMMRGLLMNQRPE